MANTFVKIASVTVGSGGAATIDFTSIPATYTDLVIKVNARNASTSGSEYFQLSFNGVTTNLNDIQLLGYTTAVSSYTDSTVVANWVNGSGTTANTFSNVDVYIPNYTSSNYKSISIDGVTENNSSATNAAYAALTAGLWSSTAAITSMTLTSKTGTFAQYTTATLYGIKNS